MAIKGENDNKFAAVEQLLNQAFGAGASGAARQEAFLNETPPGGNGPRRLALLGDDLAVGKLKTEIKQVIRANEAAPAPVA